METLRYRTTLNRMPVVLLVTIMAVMPTSKAQSNAIERLFAPRAEPWLFWDAHNELSTQAIDHTRWDTFLQSYLVTGIDGINRVQYARVSDADQRQLQHYIYELEKLPIRSYNTEQQLAFWINLYNALTVQVVLQHYPVDSIRDIDISPGFFADGPWGKILLNIEGQPVALNDIEHRILRPLWQDPRLHYALNCASLGCPNLLNKAFTADTTDTMLDEAAASYVNHPRGAAVEDGNLYVSSIYSWFRDDFGDDNAAVVHHLLRYAAQPLQAELSADTRIAGDRYDWSLNDAP